MDIGKLQGKERRRRMRLRLLIGGERAIRKIETTIKKILKLLSKEVSIKNPNQRKKQSCNNKNSNNL
jgi:hypothetical protein